MSKESNNLLVRIRLPSIFFLALILAGCGGDASVSVEQSGVINRAYVGSSAEVTVVNGESIPIALLQAYIKDRRIQASSDEDKALALSQLQDVIILAQEARKVGIEGEKGILLRMEVERLTLLSNELLARQVADNPASDVELRAEYDAQVAKTGTQEFRLHHLLVPTEEEASALMQRLESGTEFEVLEKEYQAISSSSQVGDLGWVNLSQVPPALGAEIKSLKAGDRSRKTVKTNYGYHIVKVDAVRDLVMPAYDKVKPGIRQALNRKRVEEYLAQLRSQAKISN